jgi:hypothetical protein
MHNSIFGTMRMMLLFAALLRVVVVMMQQATTRPAPENVDISGDKKGAGVCMSGSGCGSSGDDDGGGSGGVWGVHFGSQGNRVL